MAAAAHPRVTHEPLRVAVVTPTLDMARFLGGAIDSVLAQDYPHVDLLVMDGGSSDGTRELLEGYGERLRFVSGPDGGQAEAVNRGFGLTQGELFTFLNADDLLAEGAVRRAVEALGSRPTASVLYGRADHVDEHGAVIGPYPTAPLSAAVLERECPICQPAAFIRRQAFAEVGGLDSGLRYALDYDLWARLSRRHEFAYLDERLALSRLHSASKTSGERTAATAEAIRVARRHFGYAHFSWVNAHAISRVHPEGPFFGEHAASSPRSRALSLALGLRHNPRQIRRYLSDWSTEGSRERFSDGWMSKAHAERVRMPEGARSVIVRGRHEAEVRRPLLLRVAVDGRVAGRCAVRRRGPFELELELPAGAAGGEREVEVRSAWTWRPGPERDLRRLSCYLDEIAVR